jgi:CheY-like chemotaxis protein
MSTYQLALKSRNHQIFSALDGDQALSIFQNHLNQNTRQESSDSEQLTIASNKIAPPFDIVILDYRMPKKNGLEVAEQILSIAPNQRIIIASAYTHELKIPANFEQSLELLQKPFGLDVLFSTVEKAPGGLPRRYGQRPSTHSQNLPGEDSSVANLAGFDEQLNKMSDSLDSTNNAWLL